MNKVSLSLIKLSKGIITEETKNGEKKNNFQHWKPNLYHFCSKRPPPPHIKRLFAFAGGKKKEKTKGKRVNITNNLSGRMVTLASSCPSVFSTNSTNALDKSSKHWCEPRKIRSTFPPETDVTPLKSHVSFLKIHERWPGLVSCSCEFSQKQKRRFLLSELMFTKKKQWA